MYVYQCILVLKFLAMIGFGGGALASYLAEAPATRKLAVHRIASPCLLAIWLCGYGLLQLNGMPQHELWIAGSVLLSVLANGLLAYGAARERFRRGAYLGAAGSLATVVALMVMKPTWSRVLP